MCFYVVWQQGTSTVSHNVAGELLSTAEQVTWERDREREGIWYWGWEGSTSWEALWCWVLFHGAQTCQNSAGMVWIAAATLESARQGLVGVTNANRSETWRVCCSFAKMKGLAPGSSSEPVCQCCGVWEPQGWSRQFAGAVPALEFDAVIASLGCGSGKRQKELPGLVTIWQEMDVEAILEALANTEG